MYVHAHSLSASLCPISWGLRCTSPVKDKVSTVVHGCCPWSSYEWDDMSGWWMTCIPLFWGADNIDTSPREGNNILSYLASTEVILHQFEFQCHVTQVHWHSAISLTAALVERNGHPEVLQKFPSLRRLFTDSMWYVGLSHAFWKEQRLCSEDLWDSTPCFESQASAFSFNFCVLTELCSPFVGLSNNARCFSGSRERYKGEIQMFFRGQRGRTGVYCLATSWLLGQVLQNNHISPKQIVIERDL